MSIYHSVPCAFDVISIKSLLNRVIKIYAYAFFFPKSFILLALTVKSTHFELIFI